MHLYSVMNQEWNNIYLKLRTGELTPESPAGPEDKPLRETEYASLFPHVAADIRRITRRIKLDCIIYWGGSAALIGLLLAFVFLSVKYKGHLIPIFVFAAVFYFLLCLSWLAMVIRFWQLTPSGKRWIPPIPRVLLLLIPVFNCFWIFRVFPPLNELIKEESDRIRRILGNSLYGGSIAYVLLQLFQGWMKFQPVPDFLQLLFWFSTGGFLISFILVFSMLPVVCCRIGKKRVDDLEAAAGDPDRPEAFTVSANRKRKSRLLKRIVFFCVILPYILLHIAYLGFWQGMEIRYEQKLQSLEQQGIPIDPALFYSERRPISSPEALKEFNTITGRLTELEPAGDRNFNAIEQPETMSHILRENRELIAGMDHFLQTHPVLYFPRILEEGESIDLLQLPELNRLRYYARFNVQRFHYLLDSGKTAEAAEVLELCLPLRQYALDDPFLISYLVGLSIEQIRHQALLDAGADGLIGRFDKQILKRWQDSLTETEKEFRSHAMKAFEYEILLNIELRKNSRHFFQATETGPPLPVLDLYDPLLRNDGIFALNRLTELREVASRDCMPEVRQVLNRDVFAGKIRWFYLPSGMLLPALEQVVTRTSSLYGQIRTLQTGLAVELFLKKYGKLPESLEALAPEFLPAVPVNPFTGNALLYEHDDDGYRVFGGRDPELPEEAHKNYPDWVRPLH